MRILQPQEASAAGVGGMPMGGDMASQNQMQLLLGGYGGMAAGMGPIQIQDPMAAGGGQGMMPDGQQMQMVLMQQPGGQIVGVPGGQQMGQYPGGQAQSYMNTMMQ